jgi:hypothetical protein
MTLIPLAVATVAQIESLHASGHRITGRIINGVPCLIARKLP